jgi:putative transposase
MPALPICTGTVCSTSHGASSDGLRSYGVAQRAILPDVRHRTSGYSNNRAQDSHRPIRRGERQIQKFKSGSQAQQFLSAYSMIYGHLRPRRHLLPVSGYRCAHAKAFQI